MELKAPVRVQEEARMAWGEQATEVVPVAPLVVVTEVVPRLSVDGKGHFQTEDAPYTPCALQAEAGANQAPAHVGDQRRRGQARRYRARASCYLP